MIMSKKKVWSSRANKAMARQHRRYKQSRRYENWLTENVKVLTINDQTLKENDEDSLKLSIL